MIKRIKEISQVGVFSEFKDASLQFDKSTIIYGLNTYGKSTLCDIFQSLSQNDSELIKARETIPNNTKPQRIEISVCENPEPSEKSILFENGIWQSNTMNENLEVFGTSFIHHNVFTGLSFDRSNKVRFTNFILGDEGVKLANIIEAMNKNIRENNTKLKNSIPAFIKGQTQIEIDAFIDLTVKEELGQIKESIAAKQATLFQEQKLLTTGTEVMKKQEPSRISCDAYIIKKMVKQINDALNSSFESLQKDALKKIAEHLTENTTNSALAGIWLKQGIDIKKEDGNNCPFCSQDLTTVENLISAYHSYFSKEYDTFTETCISDLHKSMGSLENVELNVHKSLLSNLAILKDYSNLISEAEFADNVSEYEKSVELFQALETEIKEGFHSLIKSIRTSINQKIQVPHISVSPFDYNASSFRAELIGEYYTKLRKAQNLTVKLLKQINIFKGNLQPDKKTLLIQQLEIAISQLKKKEARLEQNGDCDKYRIIKDEIVALKTTVATTKKEMEDSQQKYIETYFDKTNELFKQLGSNDFKLQKEINSRGDRKIYGVDVIFKDKPIPKDKISIIFSESDRRALALSIFLAKVLLKPAEELEKTIVILDDPNTSFDDNRLGIAIQLLDCLSPKIAQMIILTHYPNFVKGYFELKASAKLFKIQKLETTSNIKSIDKKELCQSDHEKQCDKFVKFIKCQTQNDPRIELRVFYENHIKIIYRKQIIEFNLESLMLGSLLEELKNQMVIKKETFEKMWRHKNFLDPMHHLYSTANIENIRGQSEQIMNFLFNIDFE